MSEEQHFPRKITKELEADAQRVIDAFWKDPETVVLRGEYQQQLREDGLHLTPQLAAYHYMGIFDIAMPMTIGQLDDDQYIDVLHVKQDNQEYKTAMREVIEEFTQSLGFENIAFNQSVVAMVFLSTDKVLDIESIDDVLLPSPWSVVRSVGDKEEHLDLRIKGRTAREGRDALKFQNRFSEFFTGPPGKRNWGEVSGERNRQDAECIKFSKRYEELKSDSQLRDRYDRYNEIAQEFGYSWEAVEKKVLRGRKLVKESGEAHT